MDANGYGKWRACVGARVGLRNGGSHAASHGRIARAVPDWRGELTRCHRHSATDEHRYTQIEQTWIKKQDDVLICVDPCLSVADADRHLLPRSWDNLQFATIVARTNDRFCAEFTRLLSIPRRIRSGERPAQRAIIIELCSGGD